MRVPIVQNVPVVPIVSEISSANKISPSPIPMGWGEGLIRMFLCRGSFIVVIVVMFCLPAQLSYRTDKLRIGYSGVTLAEVSEWAVICKLC